MAQATRDRRAKKIHLRGEAPQVVSLEYVRVLCGTIVPLGGAVSVPEYRKSKLAPDYYCASCRSALSRGAS